MTPGATSRQLEAGDGSAPVRDADALDRGCERVRVVEAVDVTGGR